MSTIGRLQKVFNEEGAVKNRSIYITKDIAIEQGDTLYLNEVEESLNSLVERGFIDEAEKSKRLTQMREADRKFNRETTHVIRLAKKKQG